MAISTPAELLEWLVQRGFLSAARAETLRAVAETRALAGELIQRAWLTPYQANQILTGRGEALLVGQYRLVERIGEGAMGQVFKAWHTKLECLVAVKMIHREHLSSQKAMDRFRREVETASQLDHPNIVLLRDADQTENRPFMVMDYVEGTNLSIRVKQGGPLPVHQACEFARQAAVGLQHAYERGVVHRDVKPSNLLVTPATPEHPAIVRILDFGLARFEDDRGNLCRLTQVGAVLGTIDYIAPEQVDNASAADARCDIYSLGCTLYFLLVGRPPFAGGSVVEKLTAHRTQLIPDVGAARPDVPKGLDAVVKKMTARNPADRYQTPLEAAEALKPFTVPLAQPVKAAAPPLATPVATPATAPPPMPFAPALLTAQSPSSASGALFAFAPAFSRSGEPSRTEAGLAEPSPSVAGLIEPSWTEPGALGPARLAGPTLRKKSPRLWLGATLVGALLVGATVFVMLRAAGTLAGKQHATGAALRVRLEPAELSFNLGENKMRRTLIVFVERTKFQGPVQVSLASLPTGIQAAAKTIPEDRDQGEVQVTVSYGTPSSDLEIEVEAVAENLRDSKPLRLKVVGTRR
ncbi:MAG: serine/threonine protein kinase [Planctomycetes bacterium]|nr:serine/threonine protein kinase [Planctomycetota bacterium]